MLKVYPFWSHYCHVLEQIVYLELYVCIVYFLNELLEYCI